VIERCPQAAMVVILDSNKTEGLQNTFVRLHHGAEDFSHAVYGTCLRLKRDFDEVALSQRVGQTEQSTGHGNGLEFRFGAAAIF
jgi:hypothetical protein